MIASSKLSKQSIRNL